MNEKKAMTRDEIAEKAKALVAKYNRIIEGSEAVIAESLQLANNARQSKAEIENKMKEAGIEL